MIYTLTQIADLRRAFALHEYAILSKGRYTVMPDSSVKINPEVKFKVPWVTVQISGSKILALRYLQERWTWANGELFGSEMKMPVMTIETHKALGFWRPSERKINTNPKLFKLKSDEQILGTLFHEMAHQYNDEINNVPWRERMVNGGHGPEWVDIMLRIGMPPDKNFTGDDIVLKTEKEKENLSLRDAAKEARSIKAYDPRMLSPEALASKEYVYSVWLDIKGKAQPVVVLNFPLNKRYRSANPDQYYALTKKNIANDEFPMSLDLRHCKKLSPREVQAFPEFFKSIESLKVIATSLYRLKVI